MFLGKKGVSVALISTVPCDVMAKPAGSPMALLCLFCFSVSGLQSPSHLSLHEL